MHGNLWEWCYDFYGEYSETGGFESNPTGPSTGSYRVFRGGAYTQTSYYCRSSTRNFVGPDTAMPSIGFRIARSTVSTIGIISPNGNENWDAGSTHYITWSANDSTDYVNIEYSIDGGFIWHTIKTDYDASIGHYSWDIPYIDSEKCIVRISDSMDQYNCGQSHQLFAILPSSSITVISPNGGEKLFYGSTYEITWISTNVDSVTIRYSLDAGLSWNFLATNVPAIDEYYSWVIPNIQSDRILIQIAETSNQSNYDQSDDKASIITTSLLTVDTPNGGEVYNCR